MPSTAWMPGDDQLAQLVDGLGLGANDHVVRAGDVLGLGDAADRAHLIGDGGGLADLRLDQDVRVHHR